MFMPRRGGRKRNGVNRPARVLPAVRQIFLGCPPSPGDPTVPRSPLVGAPSPRAFRPALRSSRPQAASSAPATLRGALGATEGFRKGLLLLGLLGALLPVLFERAILVLFAHLQQLLERFRRTPAAPDDPRGEEDQQVFLVDLVGTALEQIADEGDVLED